MIYIALGITGAAIAAFLVVERISRNYARRVRDEYFLQAETDGWRPQANCPVPENRRPDVCFSWNCTYYDGCKERIQ